MPSLPKARIIHCSQHSTQRTVIAANVDLPHQNTTIHPMVSPKVHQAHLRLLHMNTLHLHPHPVMVPTNPMDYAMGGLTMAHPPIKEMIHLTATAFLSAGPRVAEVVTAATAPMEDPMDVMKAFRAAVVDGVVAAEDAVALVVVEATLSKAHGVHEPVRLT